MTSLALPLLLETFCCHSALLWLGLSHSLSLTASFPLFCSLYLLLVFHHPKAHSLITQAHTLSLLSNVSFLFV
ncbi:hypothetical protein BRARA_F00191 [Brassica rapa]|uniref:Uncharacterized protein n=1 Tax=Brassica campestris TaxID=3711 RepID=A0A397Z0U9_BRACM|nr:hypothetical protein BRARA_F00191 [Brassica rapa]